MEKQDKEKLGKTSTETINIITIEEVPSASRYGSSKTQGTKDQRSS